MSRLTQVWAVIAVITLSALLSLVAGCGGSGGPDAAAVPTVDTLAKPSPPPPTLPDASGRVYFCDWEHGYPWMRVNWDGTGLTTLNFFNLGGGFAVSPGRPPNYLAFRLKVNQVGTRGVYNPYVAWEDGSAETATRLLTDDTLICSYETISNDGRKLAFYAERIAIVPDVGTVFTEQGLYVGDLVDGNADGLPDTLANKARICELPGSPGGLDWSPDGSTLLFAGVSYSWLSFSGGKVAATPGASIQELPVGDRPRWSPDGSRIAFEREVIKAGSIRGREIYTMKPDGTDVRLVYGKDRTGYPYNMGAVWSADSSQLIFCIARDTSASANEALVRGWADGRAAPVAVTGLIDADPATCEWCWP